jgi:hypothetical protein
MNGWYLIGIAIGAWALTGVLLALAFGRVARKASAPFEHLPRRDYYRAAKAARVRSVENNDDN